MLTMPSSVRVYIAAQPTDLRKSFDGLSALVAQTFGQDPLCGHLFVFRNRRGDQMRVLFWDRTGYAILGNQPSSHYTSFGSRRGPWSRLPCRRPVAEAIPAAAVLRGSSRRLLVEPRVAVVPVRLDDAVLHPAGEGGLVDRPLLG
jgi:hypothetical protein